MQDASENSPLIKSQILWLVSVCIQPLPHLLSAYCRDSPAALLSLERASGPELLPDRTATITADRRWKRIGCRHCQGRRSVKIICWRLSFTHQLPSLQRIDPSSLKKQNNVWLIRRFTGWISRDTNNITLWEYNFCLTADVYLSLYLMCDFCGLRFKCKVTHFCIIGSDFRPKSKMKVGRSDTN